MKEKIKKIIPKFLLSFYHLSLAFIAAVFYNFPSKKTKVIGITGTSGKTTTADLVVGILEEAGYRVALLSSIKFKIKNKEKENDLKMTMPGRFKLQQFLKKAVVEKCDYVVLEVTSEGIKQYRHKFISFWAAIFTNLSPEHIEAHGGFENYKKCKGKLFKNTKQIHIINSDDQHAEYFLQFKADKKYIFSFNSDQENIIKAEKTDNGFIFNNTLIKINIPGEFNLYNALAALSLGVSQEIPLNIIKTALEKYTGTPGRMELIIEEPFKVIVDYAITPVALEKVYQTIKQNNNLICVLGSCGGGRDKWKRPVLGKIASQYCREIIITNEDPYDEDPQEIIDQIAQGSEKSVIKILDRQEAIKKALEMAQEKDTIIITGKGCEPWMCISCGKKIPWDEKAIIKQEFQNLSSKKTK